MNFITFYHLNHRNILQQPTVEMSVLSNEEIDDVINGMNSKGNSMALTPHQF
jgi:hypothetical protein